jgi:hypothetical protein
LAGAEAALTLRIHDCLCAFFPYVAGMMTVMSRMPAISIIFGILLDVAGIISFVSTGSSQKTALIPCIFGMLIFVCGIMATNPRFLKHAMHAGAVVALLGLVMGAGRFFMVLVKKGFAGHEAGLAATGSLALLCGLYLACCIKSFIEARQARQKAGF